MMNDIRKGSWESRVKMLEELAANIQPQHARNEQERDKLYSHVFRNTTDLLDKSIPNELRQRVWRVYTVIIDGQAETMGQIRYYLFNLLATYEARDDDIPYLVNFLMALTDNGKILMHYESRMGIFIIKWIEILFEENDSFGSIQAKCLDPIVQQKFLIFLINLIKYNAACIASERGKSLNKMIRYVCSLAYRSESLKELEMIYDFLNVVLSYSHLPKETLSQFVEILCIGVNHEQLFPTCNKIMRNIIGTYLGYFCLATLHHIIEDEINFSDKRLIRGAIYFLVQSLWGTMINEKSMISSSVLLAFKNLLNNNVASQQIALEIANGLLIFISSQMINDNENNRHKFASNLNAGHIHQQSIENTLLSLSQDQQSGEIVFRFTWDLVLDVCDILVSNYLSCKIDNNYINHCDGDIGSRNNIDCNETNKLNNTILDILKLLEKFFEYQFDIDENISGDNRLKNHEINSLIFLIEQNFTEKIFSIFEQAREHLSKETICNLIEHQLIYINKYRFDLEEKLKQLKHLISIYFISNQNNSIRLKCLEKLEHFLNNCTFIDVDIFWEKVASGFFLSTETNSTRELVINFLIFLAKKSCSNKNLNEFIEIFETTVQNRLKIHQRQHSLETTSQQRLQHIGPITHQHSAPITNELSIFDDAVQSVNGLKIIFTENITHIHCHLAAVNAFRFMVKVLVNIQKFHSSDDSHSSNTNSSYTRTLSLIKRKLFHTVLSLRTNTWAQLGVVDTHVPDSGLSSSFTRSGVTKEIVRFTPYILVRDVTLSSTHCGSSILSQNTNNNSNSNNNSNNNNSPPTSPQHQVNVQQPNAGINSPIANTSSLFYGAFIEALKTVIDAIQNEKDWSVLYLIFSELPKTLKHKGLILAATSSSSTHSTPSSSMTHLNQTESIPDLIVNALCNFIDSIQTRMQEINFGEMKVNKVDILSYIYNSISALVGYKLLSSSQTSIVKCLQDGLVHFSSKISCVRQCIDSLTICSIEMQTTMNKRLQDIIIQLSKITTNKALAVPKLEFLSNIILFREIYYTFTNKQYLSIFMIAQSYINTHKYGEYTVALALRVISMWFLKCPIACRMNLVHFLMKGFQNNILKETESNLSQLGHRLSSADNSAKQYNNLTLEHHYGQTQPNQFAASSSSAFNTIASPQLGTDSVILDPNDKENSKIELVEVCMDMLASNSFTTSSPLPLKPSMIDKLLNKEKTQFWMIGHKIIQITTTGCTSRAIRAGLCNKCYKICHMNKSFQYTPTETGSQQQPASSAQNSQTQPHHSFTSLNNAWNENFNDFTNNNGMGTNNCNGASNLNNNNNYQTNIASRRRHRSEINHSTKIKNANFTNDDYFMNRMINGASSHDSDLNTVSKYCRCWCQTWAEVLIRRATGTTRLIVRVENNLGDFPNWTSSMDEDDSLGQIFKNSNSDVNLAMKMQQCFESFQNLDSTKPIQEEKVTVNNDQQQSIQEQPQKTVKTSQSVARAASFGSRTSQTNPVFNERDLTKGHVRKLEKNYSFEENTPEGSQQNLTSISADCENTVTCLDPQQINTFRDRGHTISVMTPVQKSLSSNSVVSGQSQPVLESSMSASNMNLSAARQPISPAGLSPQFVFLQLYYNPMLREEFCSCGLGNNSIDKPIQLERNELLKRSLGIFDRITPYETHKIGVLYVGPGQMNSRSEILANRIGSFRYSKFLKEIGQLISLEEVDPRVFYVGGLTANDGPYAISWCDHLVQMIFHVATLMPTQITDPNCNNKMAHIGNDLVCIVYNNSGAKVDLANLKGGFGKVLQAMVMITPLEYKSNIVEIQSNQKFAEFIGHTESQVVSDEALPVYARQLALHANLGAMVYNPTQELRSYHISNWISRLQIIKRIRSRALKQFQSDNVGSGGGGGIVRGSVSPSVSGSTTSGSSVHSNANVGRLGRPSQPLSGTNDNDPAIISSVPSSTSANSPNPQSAGLLSANSNGVFDYEHIPQRLVFSDFTEFTKDSLEKH